MKNKIPQIQDLPIIPAMIAERAVWNILEAKHPNLSPEQCHKIEQAIAPKIEERFEWHFTTNGSFRKSILDKRKDMRYTCEAFMEHWTLSLLGRGKINQYL
jgi:hypothetical protein